MYYIELKPAYKNEWKGYIMIVDEQFLFLSTAY